MTKLLKAADNPTCLMLKLDTDMIMVGLLQISSGRTQREKMAFCLGDSASFPVLSLENKTKCFMEVVKSAAAVLSMHRLSSKIFHCCHIAFLFTDVSFLSVCCSFVAKRECGSGCKTSFNGQFNRIKYWCLLDLFCCL